MSSKFTKAIAGSFTQSKEGGSAMRIRTLIKSVTMASAVLMLAGVANAQSGRWLGRIQMNPRDKLHPQQRELGQPGRL